jgi:F-type H+-transporting ATPase subunit gamma
MESIKEIQGRMKSIEDTIKITNAMYMISSAKLKKAKKNLEATEPYFFTLQNTMSRILRHIPENSSVYFDQRSEKGKSERKVGYLVVSADKGMAGAYNHNIFKAAEKHMENTTNPVLFVLGEIGRHYFEKRNIPIEEQFHYTIQNPTLSRARSISEIVLENYEKEELDELYIIYTKMQNSFSTEVEMMKLLPLERANFQVSIPVNVRREELDLKPDPLTVIEHIIPEYLVGFIYGALVEAFSSEQNSRMMAMEAAVKSGTDMLKELDVIYHRARQAAITQQITEVVGGAKAQKKKKVS